MRSLRKHLAVALLARGITYARPWQERLGWWLLMERPQRRCPACHGTGRAWDPTRGGVGPCECLG